MSKPVKRILAPVHLEFDVPAGPVLSRFLAAVQEGRLFGQRCPSCEKNYVPPRAGCPRCGVKTNDEPVPVSDAGMVTSFCIVNVPFEGQTMKLPYVYASILLDGADMPLLHLVAGIEASEARMGMRVRAEWAPPEKRGPTLESILWFRPTGEPDAPFDSYKEHL
jgi:uncharacterized protein